MDLTTDEIVYNEYKQGKATYQDYLDVCNMQECEPLPKEY